MPATTPEQIHHIFVDAFNAGDIDRLMTLYEPDAANIPQPGQIARGAQQIRKRLLHLMELNRRFTFETKAVIEVGDVAYLVNKWTLSGTEPDGSAFNQSGIASEVALRRPDGTWRFVIGNPWGDQIAN